jgi:putative nucleotidyltransferase with HDIG domain
MGKPTLVVITERESLRGLLRAAAGANASSLGFATSRSDLMILLGRGDVKAVVADAGGRSLAACAHLLWVKEKQPWVRLFLMAKDEPWGLTEARQLREVATLVKPPSGLTEARHMLRNLLSEEPVEDRAPSLSEELEFEGEDADQEIILSVTELIDQLPALPIVVQRILNLLGREDSSSRQIADAISLDPALAAKVLRLVNSALFSLADPVSTVQHAVRLLGFAEIRNLTMGLKIMETSFGQAQGILDRSKFWEHSLACGVCAKHLATGLPQVDPEEAFLGGLLHDIGKLVLDTYFQEAWSDALERCKAPGRSPLDMERKVVGLPHTTIGRILAQHWKIPQLHQAAIEHHHRIPRGLAQSEEEFLFCAVVVAANLLVRWLDLGTSGPSLLLPIPRQLSGLLRLETRRLTRVLADTVKEVAEWKTSLGLGGSDVVSEPSPGETQQEQGPPPRLWVISPAANIVPGLDHLLEVSGYRVDRSSWGERLLDKARDVQCEAVVMDLRSARPEPEKISLFLKAMRGRIQAPILIVASNGLELPAQETPDGVHTIKGSPHRGVLRKWVRKMRDDRMMAMNEPC